MVADLVVGTHIFGFTEYGTYRQCFSRIAATVSQPVTNRLVSEFLFHSVLIQ
jgi:hypothetical protein